MEVPSVGCISYTLQLAVYEGLLSQCSVIDTPANEGRWLANVVMASTE